MAGSVHAAALIGPFHLSVEVGGDFLDLDLQLNGDLYFELGDFTGKALHLNGTEGVEFIDAPSQWPHSSTAALHVNDLEAVTVEGDARLLSDESWEHSTARLSSAGTIFVSGSELRTAELIIESAGPVIIFASITVNSNLTVNNDHTTATITGNAGALNDVGELSGHAESVTITAFNGGGISRAPAAGTLHVSSGAPITFSGRGNSGCCSRPNY